MFKAAVLKTVEVKASGGSNPSLSADYLESQGFMRITNKFTRRSEFVRFYFLIVAVPEFCLRLTAVVCR